MLNLHLMLLLLVSVIGEESEVPQHYRKRPVCEDIAPEIENRRVACRIEQVLRDEGFDSPLVEAALLNSYAESKFNPKAVGDNGRSRGVFQLNENGLGRKMTMESKHNVEASTKRIVSAVRKSKKLTEAIERGAETGELTRLFCTEIMRPSNKRRKAAQRSGLREVVFLPPAERRPSRSREGAGSKV